MATQHPAPVPPRDGAGLQAGPQPELPAAPAAQADRPRQSARLPARGRTVAERRPLPGDDRHLRAAVGQGPAQRANLDKGQASRAAQALVDQGLVNKQSDRQDARGVVLTLTEAGRSAFGRTMDLINRRNQAIFGCLDGSEQATLSALFDRLIEHARQP